jgi:hypothetical protein
MKNTIYIILSFFVLVIVSCNNKNTSNNLSQKDSLLFKQLNIFQRQLREETFKLYPTKNMWTFLELNTITGQIWLVQWSLEDSKRFCYVLDIEERISDEDDPICGRFSLHPTDNIYNFILLDNINGKTWQVQWGFEDNKRFVLPIK